MYAEIIDNQLLVFLRWGDFNLFKAGQMIGTRYNGEAKVELTNQIPLGKTWDADNCIQKLGNNDYCMAVPGRESHALSVRGNYNYSDKTSGENLPVLLYWPSWTSDGYHNDINQTNYHRSAA